MSIGFLGHLSVITSFVTSLIAAFSYFKVTQFAQNDHSSDKMAWLRFARGAFWVHGLAVLLVILSLFAIIYTHSYEYHYAWSHSSNNLPVYYMISCFWEGQEGSFLLWIFWHVCLGFILMRTAKNWEASVMAVFAFVQAFLTSMILGVVFFDTLKIGSSPFLLLKEAMAHLPVFKMQPDFVPKDGNGLNPLLQNYWMVIHPPTLFLGFALTLVPFAYCIAGLQNREFKNWTKPALYWTVVAALVLGVGIMMGAYWAYETLNFGGYWNWDPVENAVYVPWLILVASIHTLMIANKNTTALKTSIILVISGFISVLYATFLTRSGILGNASVHSFTDLGLSGQLILYVVAFMGLAAFYTAKAWKHLPTSSEELQVYHREFWIFLGATTLCLAGFQVLLPTSIPVYNAFLGFIGIESNLAPPSDQVAFYTKFQLWFGAGVALLSGTGQFFWWNSLQPNTHEEKSWTSKFLDTVSIPLTITMLITAAIILVGKINNWQYIVLATAAVYSVVSNSFVLARVLKAKPNLSGGAVTHIGIALMLLGILFSSGYSTVISQNTTGLMYNREFSDEMNKEHLLLFRNQPQYMKAVQTDGGYRYEYSLTYKGLRMLSRDFPTYIDKEVLKPTAEPHRMITTEDLVHEGKTYFTKGDTLQVYNENTYYEIEYEKANKEKFVLYPRIQTNEKMGNGVVPSPDIAINWKSDLYTHITNIPDPDKEKKWSKAENYTLSVGDTFVINDYIAIFDNLGAANKIDDEDINATATIRLLGNNKNFELKPAYLIKGNMVRKIPDINESLGIKISLEEIKPDAGKVIFTVNTTQKDWIILKAVEFPFIGLLWIGTIIMALGMLLSIFKRHKDSQEVVSTPTKNKQTVVS
jgi:cytochrome c-type biogenesis protein CcmF